MIFVFLTLKWRCLTNKMQSLKTIKLAIYILLLLILTFPSLPAFGSETLNIEALMSYKEFKEVGLDQLSPEQVKLLNNWLNQFIAKREGRVLKSEEDKKRKRGLFEVLFKPDLTAYEIQEVDGNRFRINNHEFEMIKKCAGFKKGDEVIFKEGSANGVCRTATFVNSENDQSCRVWCEEE